MTWSARGKENSPSRSRLVLTKPLMPYQHGPEPERSHMARKPKAARSSNFATSPEEVLAVLSDAPAPARRGRKLKAAALPEPLAMMDSDDAAGGTADADGSIAEPVTAPMRKRPGLKPKQRAGTAEATSLQDDVEATSEQEAPAPDANPEPMPAAGDKLDADVAGQQEQVAGQESATLQATPDPAASDAASPGSSQNTTISAQPAAQWDRETDSAQFDWAEIERTASQDGPNQPMAKLLVAARAEGANSRWPL